MSPPSHHANISKTLFQNPWKTPEEPDENATQPESPSLETGQIGGLYQWLSSGVQSLLMNIPLEIAKDLSHHKIVPKKVVEPQFYRYAANEKSLKATWLGHAVSAR